MRGFVHFALLSLIFGAAAPLRGQGGLDLAGALAQARRTGPLAKLAEARRQADIGRVREAGQLPNPTIEWRRENLGSSLQPDIFATLYLPVDVTGRRLALRQAAGAGRDRADAVAESERRAAELEVARAWLRAAAANGARDIARTQYEALRELAAIDAERLREGLVSEAVGLRTSLEADRARLALVSANAEATRARAELARLLGLADGTVPPLAPLTAPTLPAAPDSSSVGAIALRNRPDVRAREAALLEAQRRHTAERRGLLGDLQLQGGTKETSGFLTGQVGLALPMPLFNRNGGARQRTAGELAEAQLLRDDLRQSVVGAVTAAWQAYRDVRDAAADAASFDVRGLEVARIARVSYREGHATLTELLDAERAAADARQAHLRWAVEAWLARLEFERAIGARLDERAPLALPLLTSPPSTGS